MSLPSLAWIAGLGLLLRARAQIRVMSPQSLVQSFADTNAMIEGSTATFGAPFYGDRVLGRVIFAESTKNHTHCKEDDYQVPRSAASGGSSEGGASLIDIFMVRRGKCSFTTKVRIASSKGAHAVIIVDKEESGMTRKELANIIVADDGYGDKIHIPSILITKQDGKRLIDAAKVSEVVVELAWNIPTNHVVKTDIWMSSASRESMKFLKGFAKLRRLLNDVLIFQPHFPVFGMDTADPQLYNGLCLDEGGKYCAEDPDGPGPVTGKDVLLEDVRQLCIHELYKKPRTSSEFAEHVPSVPTYAAEYWDYIALFLDRCPVDGDPHNPEAHFGEACSLKLMAEVGVDAAKVQLCDGQTRFAKVQYEKANPAWSPRALRINGWRYSGILDGELVSRAICSGFIKQPEQCANMLALLQPRNPFEHFTGGGGVRIEGVGYGAFFSWLFGTFALGCVALLLYKRFLKKEMRMTVREEVMLEVREQMGEYCKMQG